MSRMAAVFKEEISRLSRKETRRSTLPLKRRVAALENIVREQRRELKQLARRAVTTARSAVRAAAGAMTARVDDGARLTARSIRGLRKKLRLTQADFAGLTGVTPVAVYFWESGRTKPHAAKRQAIHCLRGLCVRAV